MCREAEHPAGTGGGLHRGCARRWLKDFGFACRIGHTQGCATAPITHIGSPCCQIPRAVTKLPDLTPCSFLGAVPGRVGAAAGPPAVTATLFPAGFRSVQHPRPSTMASIPSSGSLMATHNYRRSKSLEGGCQGLSGNPPRAPWCKKGGAQQPVPAGHPLSLLLTSWGRGWI